MTGYAEAVRSDPAGVAAVLRPYRPTHARELAWAIERESNWRPSARNPISGAVGLIQFLPLTLARMGGPPAAVVVAMNRAEQAPLVHRYLASVGWPARARYPGDIGIALLAPGYIGVPDEYVLYPAGSAAARGNPGLQSPDGAIRAGKVRRLYTPPDSFVLEPGRAAAGPSTEDAFGLLVLAGIALALALYRRRRRMTKGPR